MRDLLNKSDIGMILVNYIQNHGNEIVKRGYKQENQMLVKDKEGHLLLAKLTIEEHKKENT